MTAHLPIDHNLRTPAERAERIRQILAFEKQRLDNIERHDTLMRFRRKMRQAHGAAY